MTDSTTEIQGLRTEVVALTQAVKEHKDSFHREINRMDAGLRRYHERVDKQEDAIATMQTTLGRINVDQVNRVVNRMDYVFSGRAMLKAAAVLGTAAAIGTQIVGFLHAVL